MTLITCESCNQPTDYNKLVEGTNSYKICLTCLSELVNLRLTEDHFFNLLGNGHTTEEFYLHSDFYNSDTGEALQPQ